MNRPNAVHHPDPWRVLVTVAQIPDTGLHREIEASPREREAVAEVAGLREVLSARASFDVMPKAGGRVHVVGRVQAKVGQTCVVTLDPIESDIDEEIDLMFAPEAEARELTDLIAEGQDEDDDEGDNSEVADPPEAIVNGAIDLGRLATDALYLGVDPYPRKPGAVFEARVEAPDPEDHPFASLKTLRDKPKD
jgi:Large ribosomal RNA subunit accumulation protein YceD